MVIVLAGFQCGGKLLLNSAPIILTAVHCVEEKDVSPLVAGYAYIGRAYRDDVEEDSYQTLVLGSSDCHIHPKYDPDAFSDGYDIALTVLTADRIFSATNQTSIDPEIDPLPTIPSAVHKQHCSKFFNNVSKCSNFGQMIHASYTLNTMDCVANGGVITFDKS